MGNMSNSELQVTRQRPEDYFAAKGEMAAPVVLPTQVSNGGNRIDPALVLAIVAITIIVALIIFVLVLTKRR